MRRKVALITGANKGIGFEVCHQLAKRNIDVILTSRNPALGESATKKLQNLELSITYCPLDVTNIHSIDSAFEYVNKLYGTLDILVNNAGIAIDADGNEWGDEEQASLFKAKIETLQKTLETNTYGPIRMIQKFVPLMKAQNYGRVVNLSSGMGQLSEMNGRWPAYRISKTALNAVTRITADELKQTDILVNSACPG